MNIFMFLFSEKISDSCYYIDVKNEKMNPSNDDFTGSLNMDRMDTVTLIIDSVIEQNVYIRVITPNAMGVKSGECCIRRRYT